MSAEQPGATADPQDPRETPPLASPDLQQGYEEDSGEPELVDPAGEQILPEELTEVDPDPGDKTGLHDRAGDEKRFT